MQEIRYAKLIVIALVLLALVPPAATAAEEESPGEDGKPTRSWFANPLGPLNELGIGTFSGKAQTLFLRRAWGDKTDKEDDAHATTMALTIDYQSPRYYGLQFGAEFIQVWEMLEGGTTDYADGAAEQLCNSGYTTLNNGYLEYRADAAGLADTHVRAGRLPLDLFFAPSYAIRQKKQAYTGVVVSSRDVPNLDLSLGHIQRFSGWCSRDDDHAGTLGWDFKNVGQVAGTDKRTAGMQFVSATYSGIPNAKLGVWDFYGQDTFNTLGVNTAYTFEPFDSFYVVPKVSYSTQTDVGNFTSETGIEVDSDVIDAAMEFRYSDFTIEPGYFKVFGDSEDNDYRLPFRSKFTIDPLLMWYPRRFKGGSESFYVKSTYRWKDTKFYVLYVRTETDDYIDNGSVDQEVNVVVSQKIWEGLSVSFKGGYGIRDVGPGVGSNPDQSDIRVFLTYAF